MRSKPFRILLLIDDASIGGGQQHLLWLAERLDRAEFEVAVGCEPQGYLVDQLRERGIPHYPLLMSNVPSPWSIMACRSVIRRFRPDLLHTHGGTAGFTGRLAAATVRGVRVVHTYHGIHYLHDGRAVRKTLLGGIEAALLRTTDRVICVSRRDVDTGVRVGIVDPAKTVVVLNGIDSRAFFGHRSYAISGGPCLGTIGRLHAQKGHAVLLDALPALRSEFPGLRCRIIGEGELMGALRARATALGIEACVEFAGSRTDVADQLNTFDIFLLPSLWEGLPLVLLEAMASGSPVVASAVDGVGEIVTDGRDAVLVPPGDPAALAAAVRRLVLDEDLRMRLGNQARETVRERFGIDRMVRETEDVYRSVLT